MIGRLLLILGLSLGVGLYLPDSRAIIIDWLEPVLQPGYRWMTRQELREIARNLDTYLEGRGSDPLRESDFNAWLQVTYPQASSRFDSWGTRYSAEASRRGVLVFSAGPDRRFRTADDLDWEEARD